VGGRKEKLFAKKGNPKGNMEKIRAKIGTGVEGKKKVDAGDGSFYLVKKAPGANVVFEFLPGLGI